jgi:hypothetical protein
MYKATDLRTLYFGRSVLKLGPVYKILHEMRTPPELCVDCNILFHSTVAH